MKTSINFFLAVLFPLFSIQGYSQASLRINEIMISNIGGYMADYDFPDSWVEIHNSSSKQVSLKDYSLEQVTEEGLESYIFPSDVTIPANGYFVVCCDKLATTFHTSFKLNAEGGTLTLKSSDGGVEDNVTYPGMIAPGVAYGRTVADESLWQWERNSTPGVANEGTFTDLILPFPVFSNQGHVMSGSEEVNITIPDGDYPDDTKIYITTNGKEPTFESQSATEFHFTIDRSTVIRAKLLSESALSRPSVTQSYIFHPREIVFPIISIVADSSYLYDNELGIFSSDTVLNNKPNYSYDWRRPINMEYLACDLDSNILYFNQLGEIGLSGASSRKAPQKSLKLIADKRFGTKHINGKLWTDKPNVAKNKSVLLRNGGSCTSTYRITDGFIQTLFGRHIKNLDWQAYTPAITYINGEYYGICGLRERSDENYVWSNYDGEENIERLEGLTLNTSENFNQFRRIFNDSISTFSDISAYLDIDEFVNHLCVEIFSGNTDWPYNNVSIWRNLNGGKWRFITKDIDYVGIAVRAQYTTDVLNFNYFDYLTVKGDKDSQEYKSATFETRLSNYFNLFKKILPMPEFRDKIVDCLTVYLGDFLKPNVTQPLLERMRDEIDTELTATWKKHYSRNTDAYFRICIGKTLSFLSCRPRKVYQHMADFYGLGSVIPMTLKPKNAEVRINSIELTEGDFDGCYFSDRTLRLSSGRKNIGWNMTTYTFGEDTVSTNYTFETPEISLMLKDYEGCDSVSFETNVFADDEFDMKLRELAIDKTQCADWSEKENVEIDEPQYAYANLTDLETLPTSKDDEVRAYIDFYDNQGNYFRKPIVLSLQGSSEPKVNLSLQFVDKDWDDDDAPSFTFGNWVEQDEFHLKAFQEDALRGTSEVAYKFYDQMLGITDGARLTGDAFPMSLYVNGNYYGMMAWQLKKHRKNMNLVKDDAANVWLDGKLNEKQLFGGEINWTKFEVRNPKDLYNMDGTDYDGDNPQEIIDASSTAYTGKKKMLRCAEAKQHIIGLSNYNSELQTLESGGATKEEMRTAIGERFDTTNLINYIVFSLITNNYDGFSENWQWYTVDGKKWKVAPYDCDLTFGYNDDSNDLWSATRGSKKYDYKMENALSNSPMPWIKRYFWDDIKACYAEFRDRDIINDGTITAIAQEWNNRIGSTNYTDEYETWGIGTNNIESSQDLVDHIKSWTSERIALEDVYLEYTPIADVNGDGRIDICDMSNLINYLSVIKVYDSHYDINRDGKLNVDDVYSIRNKVLQIKR